MKNELMRIEIAKFCGWRKVRMSRGRPFLGDDEGQVTYNALCGSPPGESLEYCEELPEYCNDLNAIHCAEKVLTAEQCYQYHMILMKVLGDWKPQSGADTWPWHATASQRAEALLRTIGKWEAIDKALSTSEQKEGCD